MSPSSEVLLVDGTHPELIKPAPIARLLRDRWAGPRRSSTWGACHGVARSRRCWTGWMRSSRTAGPLRWWSGGHQLGARHPPAPFGDYFWDPGRDQLGACLFDDLDLEAVVAGSGRTWIVLAVPDACWSTERVIETIDRTGRTVTRTDLDGPSTLLLVE